VPRPVLTKKDFVQRYSVGEFGNASPTWNNYKDWDLSAGYYHGESGLEQCKSQLYHIRNRIKGGKTWYNVERSEMSFLWNYCLHDHKEKDLYISAMAPTEKTLIQGEVIRDSWGYSLYYSTIKKPMRDALQEQSRSVSGIIAILLLRDYLCPKSFEWMQHLLETYPQHVVEFSTYSTNWGTIPGFNTVFWEVRSY
jgi:hypothetical protein